jgi:hypothetical protein
VSISPILWPTVRYLQWVVRFAGLGWALYDSFFAESHERDDTELLPTWRRFAMEFTRPAPSGFLEDKAIMTWDLYNVTDNVVDNTWTTTDFTTVEGHFLTWWTSVKTWMHTGLSYAGGRWYRMQFAPLTSAKPFKPSGPPVRIYQPSPVPGTGGTQPLAFQTSCAVTERTPLPRHWGRSYLPTLASSSTVIDTNGRWTSGLRTAIAGAYDTLDNNLRGSGFGQIVPVTQLDRAAARGWLGITGFRVDDVPDVIRRRRPKFVAVRTILP